MERTNDVAKTDFMSLLQVCEGKIKLVENH